MVSSNEQVSSVWRSVRHDTLSANFSVISGRWVWEILFRLLSDISVIMFAPLNVKLIMNDTWTWWVIHDGVWVDGGEPPSDWSIQNLAWRLQNDSTLWKREKIKKMKNAWKYKRYIKFKKMYVYNSALLFVLWYCRS